jgi:hypothetical protein
MYGVFYVQEGNVRPKPWMIEHTRRGKASCVRVAILPIAAHCRVRRRQSGRVWLIVAAFSTTVWIHGSALLRRLTVHGLLLLVALRRWSILSLLAGLLLLRRVWLSATRWKRLAVGAIKLRIWRWILTAPNGVRWHESLSLSADGSENTFL